MGGSRGRHKLRRRKSGTKEAVAAKDLLVGGNTRGPRWLPAVERHEGSRTNQVLGFKEKAPRDAIRRPSPEPRDHGDQEAVPEMCSQEEPLQSLEGPCGLSLMS
ncbi:hypothetical protein Nepgr_016177 [Nepenthes gracilis]|uniref:Uncharacterized protein n=1 Tax=Nepenthes gracilis TaxID=150966 RepID=A0AAD3SPU0_NEPGR|nr:hypothetical protein Nepgr_016177 [Nepenthes gracilis]